MTLTRKVDIELFLCLFAVAAVASFFVVRGNNPKQPQLSFPIVSGSSSSTMVSPTDPVLQVDTAMQPSPDGTKQLSMKVTHNKDGTLSYDFKTTDPSGGNELAIYKTTVASSSAFAMPFNAWSPDDKYVFIQRSDGDAYVFTASGTEIIPGQQYLDVGDLFNATGKTDSYRETTGWASETLLIVNTTKKSDNTKGSSYWFEVPTKAIIQLSSQF